MGISLRHHVLALVASFLMLLVGLLVGVGLSSEPGLQERLDKVEARFEVLWGENQALQEGANRQEEFAQAVLPRLVQGTLHGQVIPLLITTRPLRQSDDAATQLTDALEAAGARAPYRLAWDDDFAERAVGAYDGDTAAACEAATKAVAAAVLGADEEALQKLRKRKLIRLQGEVPREAPTAIVVLGGAESEAESGEELIDRPLLEALAAAGLTRVVGCEATPPASYISLYRDFDISTVDNVDSGRGQVSAAWALAGQSGDYGDQSSARRPFPEPQ
jgi:hypothetical protein